MLKILLIDDSDEHLNEVKEVILDHIDDVKVFIADSGQEGLKIARKELPDTIISDVQLPEMDGIEICRTIKEDEMIKFIPVVMLTGSRTDAETRSKCLQAGADVFLTKPIDAEELIAQIQVMLRIKKAEDQLRKDKEDLENIVLERTKDLEENETKLRSLFNSMKDLVMELDYNGKYIYIAPTSPDLLYASAEELEGKSLHEVFPKPEADRFLKFIHKTLDDNTTHKIEYPLKIEGNTVWFEGRATPKTKNTVLYIARDITERKRAEEEVKKSEERYRKLFESSKDAIMTLSPPDWRFTSGNKAIFDMFKIKDIEEFIAIEPWKVSPERQSDGSLSEEKAKREIEKAMKEGSNFFEWTHKRLHGETFPATVLLTRVDVDGDCFLQATVRDISDYKHTLKIQETLYKISKIINSRLSLKQIYLKIKEHLGDILDTSNFCVALYDEKNDYISLPFDVDEKDSFIDFPEGKTLTRYVIKTGKPILVKKEDQDKMAQEGKIEIIGSRSEVWLGVPLKIVDKVMGTIAVQSYDNPNSYSDEDIEILSFIAEEMALAIMRKRDEEELKESERKISTLLANLPGIAYRCKNFRNWTMEFISDGCKELTGYVPEELINDKSISFNDIIHPDDREKVWDTIQDALKKNEQYVLEYRIITKDKKERWVWERGKGVPSGNGLPDILEGFISDITLRKHALQELIKNRERLKTASSIIRHDIMNDLVVIQSALKLYRHENDEAMLKEIDKRLEKSMSTIEKHRRQESYLDSHVELDEYELKNVFSEIIDNHPHTSISFEGKGKVYADNAIYSVLENIIDNAIKHAKASKIDITIKILDDICEVRISDNGSGVPEHIKDKIFDEGFQFGDEGHTGIGLYIVRKTIEEYGGSVTVEDNDPHGAIFVLQMQKVI